LTCIYEFTKLVYEELKRCKRLAIAVSGAFKKRDFGPQGP